MPWFGNYHYFLDTGKRFVKNPGSGESGRKTFRIENGMIMSKPSIKTCGANHTSVSAPFYYLFFQSRRGDKVSG